MQDDLAYQLWEEYESKREEDIMKERQAWDAERKFLTDLVSKNQSYYQAEKHRGDL